MDDIVKTINLPEKPPNKGASTNTANAIIRAIAGLGTPNLRMPGSRTTDNAPFIAVVTDIGPDDEDDYTDERYWVRRSRIDGDDSETLDRATEETHITTSYWNSSVLMGEDTTVAVIVTATNLMEGSLDKEEAELDSYQSGTHLLPVGTRVLVFTMYDANATQRYVMFPICPLRTVAVLITGNAVGGGVYTAKMISEPTSDFLPAENASDDALGDVPDEDDCFAVNMAESGQSTHDLTEGSPISAVFVGVIRPRKTIKCDADGTANEGGTQKHVVVFNGYDFLNCAASGPSEFLGL